MRGFLLATAGLLALAGLTGLAAAADFGRPVYKAPPPAYYPPVYNWTGLYMGVNAGYGWGTTDWSALGSSFDLSGGLFGGQVGYNWQFGSFVAGVEGDFDGATISKTDNFGFKQKTDELASARARIGYAVLPNLLAYGTGGYAYGHTNIDQAVGSVNQNGWAAGGGLEYKLWGPLIARGEYLHYGFGNQSFPAIHENLTPCDQQTDKIIELQQASK